MLYVEVSDETVHATTYVHMTDLHTSASDDDGECLSDKGDRMEEMPECTKED